MKIGFLLIAGGLWMIPVGLAQVEAGKSSTKLKVDHASVCGTELEPMRNGFADAGLATDYGGAHASGGTHMALLAFDDGSYLELIAPQKAGQMDGADWAKMMAGNSGACAWAVGSSDIKADVARFKALGIETEGPGVGSRRKPDGRVLEWETASVGSGVGGATLPFMIQDHTPREWRVTPSASVKGSGLTGIEVVVLGVRDLDAAIALFRKAYGWEAPAVEERKDFGAKVAYFRGTPVMLATPLDKTSWLTPRLEKFGDGAAAYLLGTSDFGAAEKRFKVSTATQWFGRNIAWFDGGKLHGLKMGIVQ